MKLLSPVLIALCVATVCAAENLGGEVEITVADSWTTTSANVPGVPVIPFPTLKLVPKDGRDASLLITLLPRGVAVDLPSLKRMFQTLISPLNPPKGFAPLDFDIPQAAALYGNLEDPKLVGKPVQKNNYKFATPIGILLAGKHTLYATLYTDEITSSAYKDGLQIVRSVRIAASSPLSNSPSLRSNPSSSFSMPHLNAALHIPERFKSTGTENNSHPGYFSYADHRGVILSGWLDDAKGYPGMKTFWAKEKAVMKEKTGIVASNEMLKLSGRWSVVLYTVSISENLVQKNLRACQVLGDTWADVHLSITSPESTWSQLEDALKAISLTERPSKI